MKQRTILLTGSTDGIGFETAKLMTAAGHRLLLHGRSIEKLNHTERVLLDLKPDAQITSLLADLSDLGAVRQLAESVRQQVDHLDVVVNNAGVFKTPNTITATGLDVRFVVNTIAPYLLVKLLLPALDNSSRVVNLSSAAQAPVNENALRGKTRLDDGQAYAQSKLAITMWSRHLASILGTSGPAIIAVNPGSLLATNMVRKGYGIDGNDVSIGANILIEAALGDRFADATGQYYDNDSRQFASPHPDATDAQKNDQLVRTIESLLS